jgi:hypothetical protein
VGWETRAARAMSLMEMIADVFTSSEMGLECQIGPLEIQLKTESPAAAPPPIRQETARY